MFNTQTPQQLAAEFDARMPLSALDAATLLDELPDGAVVISGEGLIEAVNRAFLELVNRDRSELVGHRIEDMVADEELLRILGLDALFGAEVTRDNNVIFTGGDGHNRTLLVNSTHSKRLSRTLLTARATGAVQQELADTTRWVANEQERADAIAQARDELIATNAALTTAQMELEGAYAKLQGEVEARLKLERELRVAQKLESVGQLAAGIAHEINTPAQYVGDSIQFLAESFENVVGLVAKYRHTVAAFLTASGQEQFVQELAVAEEDADLAYIEEQAPAAFASAADGVARIATIVSAMKEFAHPDGRAKCAADLNRAIQTTLTISNNEYKYVADVETEFGELPPVSCHVGEINQVILNLLVNAAHAISGVVGGSCNKGRITVRTSQEHNCARIDISDTGCGIPPEIRERVFDPFFTTKEIGAGSGQGLAISRSIIVDKHGGSLTFESEVGQGTTFSIRLPVEDTSQRCKEES